MISKLQFAVFTLLFCSSTILFAGDKAESQKPISLSPFGTKPIQLSVDKDGIKRKEGGFVCDLKAFNGSYSEWGETEDDAKTIVMKTCSDKSGLLLCKKDKITCTKDE